MYNTFPYGTKETEYLKRKDKRLGEIIDMLGHPERPVSDDLFACVIDSIIGQQISTKAQETVSARLRAKAGCITPTSLSVLTTDELQSLGMTFRKAGYIHDFALKVTAGKFDPDAIEAMTDDEAIKYLSSLNGIGVWTAEMILLHCLRRPDILSYGDLAILRGMRMVYKHRKISREQFEKYRRRYSPYGSTASIYLWKVSAGAVPGLTDPGRQSL